MDEIDEMDEMDEMDAMEMTRMGLPVVELLLPDESIPTEVRMAIVEGRTADAGLRLMELFDLSCDEAAALIDRCLCD